MRILIVLTYYRPHTSGLTIYAERLAKALARRGHHVTILTSQYDKQLPREEITEGVHVVRVPVLMRVSKGVIMPSFGPTATRYVLENDVIQLHLPQFDAAGVALRGRLLKKPTVITYHCDLRMPPGVISWLANQAIRVMNNLAGIFTHRMVTYTDDYATHSNYLSRYLPKLKIIPPPVELPKVSPEQVAAFHRAHNPQDHRPVIGMAARFATEKGVEVLVRAMPEVLARFPDALVQFAGPYENIIGEQQYFARLAPEIHQLEAEGHWQFLGSLSPEQMATFYPNIDLLVLSSLNSTEAFGLVQIEAMLNGVPCVASDLPGVRQPVLRHDMGKIFPIGDSHRLAEAIIEVLENRDQYKTSSQVIAKTYNPDTIAEAYEKLFLEMLQQLQPGKEKKTGQLAK